MRDFDYLSLLSERFGSARECRAEIANLRAILDMPKGTEYFFSDIHGEDKAFIHLLRTASGNIMTKLDEVFGQVLSEADISELAALIYRPHHTLRKTARAGRAGEDWQKVIIFRLVKVCRHISSKYTRSKVRKKMPEDYARIIEEMIQVNEADPDKQVYFRTIIDSIVETGGGPGFIADLCNLIHAISIDQLHILGDLFDRGPRADRVLEELMQFDDVDFVWGNHDVCWMGAHCGNDACICNVLRNATGNNSFDVLEDGYGISLRALSMFAQETYGDDPCERFLPRIMDENKFDSVEPALAARMHKAISVMQFKAEGQLIGRHPEYGMEDRRMLHRIDWKEGTITIGGKTYPLADTSFPTVDPLNPYAFSPEEEALMEQLRISFRHSPLLQKHIRYIYRHGTFWRVVNDNLMYHGCVPMTEDGAFAALEMNGKSYSGRALMDYFTDVAVNAYYLDPYDPRKQDAVDQMWLLWCGRMSPVFGKEKMATFERLFLDEKELCEEPLNPYYRFVNSVETAERILREFGADPGSGHIINGHVPVKQSRGESPVRAEGKLFMIDGGLAKSFHEKTGIAGYTLIYNSRCISVAEHQPFREGEEATPKLRVVEQFSRRRRVSDTDKGRELRRQIEDLMELLRVYNDGLIREKS